MNYDNPYELDAYERTGDNEEINYNEYVGYLDFPDAPVPYPEGDFASTFGMYLYMGRTDDAEAVLDVAWEAAKESLTSYDPYEIVEIVRPFANEISEFVESVKLHIREYR